LLEPEERQLEATPALLEERQALAQELERLLRVAALDLDVREQMVRPGRGLHVLGRLDRRERLAGVTCSRVVVPAGGVQPRLRPVEARPDNRVCRLARPREGAAEHLLGARQVPT